MTDQPDWTADDEHVPMSDRISGFVEYVYDPDSSELSRQEWITIGSDGTYPENVRAAIEEELDFDPNEKTAQKTPYMAATDLMASRVPKGIALRTLAMEWERMTGNRPPAGNEVAVNREWLEVTANTLEKNAELLQAQDQDEMAEELWNEAEEIRDALNDE